MGCREKKKKGVERVLGVTASFILAAVCRGETIVLRD